MKNFSFALLALLSLSSASVLAEENVLRYYDPTVKDAFQGEGSESGKESMNLSQVVPSSQKDYSIKYMYGCSTPFECVGFDGSEYMQRKSSTIGFTYEMSRAVSMAGFEWSYDLPNPHINKFPRTVNISIFDGSSFVSIEDQPLSSTGGDVKRIIFSKPLPPTTAIRFTFTGSQDGNGYIALQYFNPLAVN